MAASHLLTHIEQQGIVACIGDVDGGFKDMTLAHFALAAFRRGDIYHFLFSLALALGEAHALTTGVELRQSVVVPKDTIALAGYEHGDGDLRVYLGETARETAHVAVAILKLSESVEKLIVGRDEREGSLTIFELMVGGCEDGLTLGIADFNLLLLGIDGDRDILTILEWFRLHIKPFWQVALDVALGVLDADGIPRERRHSETPLREGRLCRSAQAESHRKNDGVYLLHITLVL